MKHYQYFGILSAIYFTPHLGSVGPAFGLVSLVAMFVAAIREE